MTLNTSHQFREVNRFDRVLFRMVRFARRLVDWSDGKIHNLEVALRHDFSQRREQSEAQRRSPAPRSFAVEPKMSDDAMQRLCVDLRNEHRKTRRQRQRRHITAADFDRRFTEN